MKRWQVGIIGLGWAGDQHARAMRELKDRVEIPVLAEIDSNLAQDMSTKWKVPGWTTNYHELLKREDLDAVSICLPHELHSQVAIEAAQAGLHILIEKPISATLAEADAMIKAASSASVTLMVAENVRYDNIFIQAAELAQSGKLGELFLVRISREHNMRAYLNQRPWFLTDKYAGIMVSGGIHDFELLRMLAGEIEHVYALKGTKVFDEMCADDNSVALAGMKNGAVATIVETYFMRTPQSGVFCSVHGSKGSMWFHGFRSESIRLYLADQDDRPGLGEEVKVSYQDTFVTEMAHFLDCLEDPDLEPITSGREERKPLVAVMAAYESFRTGQRVILDEFDSQ